MDSTERFDTMREIGRSLDMTSHQVGRILKTTGWRYEDGSPTMAARQKGLAITYSLEGGGYAWKWQESFVRQLAEAWKNKTL